ncbi:hypothetical protein SUGI_0122920 [Cryptomeria japonica]|nr:hypothetical protein SUGI_0122920 [Cryptomeria japonica]
MLLIWVLYITLLHRYYGVQHGEAASATITDPQEVEALKAIKYKMRNRKWAFSEDPCSGKGSWNVSQDYETQNEVVCEMYTTGEIVFPCYPDISEKPEPDWSCASGASQSHIP